MSTSTRPTRRPNTQEKLVLMLSLVGVALVVLEALALCSALLNEDPAQTLLPLTTVKTIALLGMIYLARGTGKGSQIGKSTRNSEEKLRAATEIVAGRKKSFTGKTVLINVLLCTAIWLALDVRMDVVTAAWLAATLLVALLVYAYSLGLAAKALAERTIADQVGGRR